MSLLAARCASNQDGGLSTGETESAGPKSARIRRSGPVRIVPLGVPNTFWPLTNDRCQRESARVRDAFIRGSSAARRVTIESRTSWLRTESAAGGGENAVTIYGQRVRATMRCGRFPSRVSTYAGTLVRENPSISPNVTLAATLARVTRLRSPDVLMLHCAGPQPFTASGPRSSLGRVADSERRRAPQRLPPEESALAQSADHALRISERHSARPV